MAENMKEFKNKTAETGPEEQTEEEAKDAELTEEAAEKLAEKLADEMLNGDTVKLRRPTLYNGEELTELVFDFDRLTGRDAMNISRELTRKGISAVSPALSDDYLMRMAVKACVNVKIGIDLFPDLTLADYNRVLLKARNFLLM